MNRYNDYKTFGVQEAASYSHDVSLTAVKYKLHFYSFFISTFSFFSIFIHLLVLFCVFLLLNIQYSFVKYIRKPAVNTGRGLSDERVEYKYGNTLHHLILPSARN